MRLEGERWQIEREVRLSGELDQAQLARLHEIAEKTPVTRLIRDGTPIITDLR